MLIYTYYIEQKVNIIYKQAIIMLSYIQQFIIEECMDQSGNCSRVLIDKNYKSSKSIAKQENFRKIITQSIERLIDRGLLVGYGMKTKEKLFITKIRLTSIGKREALEIRKHKQKRLPLKKHKLKYVPNKNTSI